jgi:hypothetical protein
MKWNKKTIHVPSYMNNVARYSTNEFLDWLTLVQYPIADWIILGIVDINIYEKYAQQKKLNSQQSL